MSNASLSCCREYDRFVKRVAGLMGEQLPASELQEASQAVWEVVQDVPRPEEAVARRISSPALYKPYRCGSSMRSLSSVYSNHYWEACRKL